MKHSGKASQAGLRLIGWFGAAVAGLLLVALLAKYISAFVLDLGGALVVLWALFAVFTFYFFRDPEANTPEGKNLVVSPGHGTVDVIDTTTEPEFMGGEVRRISIFLSVFNVHVQNAPVTGRTAWFKHKSGQYLNALRVDCADFNENVYIGIEALEPKGAKVGVRLIAGLIARRIVPWVGENEAVLRGQRISLIQFGSRVNVYLPLNTKVKVALGDKVVGGNPCWQSLNDIMATPPVTNASPPSEGEKLKIYFLPNLMTAGNLFCGFLALTKIVEADPDAVNFPAVIHEALFLILLACIFDLLDGRVARMGGRESPFGREFDSLADVVSFGAAPAFLVHRIVLKGVFVGYPQLGWFIASVYLLCGAFRLARFNCLAAMNSGSSSKEFLGFPIPAAAGLVASLTLFLLWLDAKGFNQNKWRFALPVLLIFLSCMMVSEVKYPSFKSLHFRSRGSFLKVLIMAMCIGLFFILWDKVLPILAPLVFTIYLLYGFVRPFISRALRKEIEDEGEEDEEPEAAD